MIYHFSANKFWEGNLIVTQYRKPVRAVEYPEHPVIARTMATAVGTGALAFGFYLLKRVFSSENLVPSSSATSPLPGLSNDDRLNAKRHEMGQDLSRSNR